MRGFGQADLPVLLALAGLLGLLVIASGITWWLGRRHPERDHGELVRRVRSWWVIVLLFAAAFLAGPGAVLVLLALVSFLALKEYLSLIPTRRADRRVLFWAYLAIPVQYWWIHIGWYGMFVIFIPVYMFLLLPVRMLLIGATEGFLRAAGTLHWGLMACVFSLSHAAWLLVLPTETGSLTGGAGLLLLLLVLTQLNDVAQYVAGKRFGRRKVVPKVSPGKTVEGLVGGIAASAVVALALAPWLGPFGRIESLGLGAGLALAGFFGDVTVSAIKRDLGIKDSGSLIPGHGGVLDRVDSLTFTAPLFLHYTRYMHF